MKNNLFGFNSQLSLPSSSLPLVYRNPLQHLVSTLPYVDEEITDAKVQNQVQLMIQLEMKNLPQQDYLSSLPIPQVHYTDLLRNEMQRVENQIPMERTNFESKYMIESEPQTKEEIFQALDLCNMKEQHLQISQINSELMNKYGAALWKKMLSWQDQEKHRLQEELTKAKVQMNEINAQRKYEQVLISLKQNYQSQRSNRRWINIDIKLESQKLI